MVASEKYIKNCILNLMQKSLTKNVIFEIFSNIPSSEICHRNGTKNMQLNLLKIEEI